MVLKGNIFSPVMLDWFIYFFYFFDSGCKMMEQIKEANALYHFRLLKNNHKKSADI